MLPQLPVQVVLALLEAAEDGDRHLQFGEFLPTDGGESGVSCRRADGVLAEARVELDPVEGANTAAQLRILRPGDEEGVQVVAKQRRRRHRRRRRWAVE